METTGDGAQAQLDAWGADSVRAKYGNIIAKVERHKQATETKEAQRYLEEAEELLAEYRGDLDEKVLGDFREAGVEDITLEQVQAFDPFHWVLEFATVYADGGFDVIVGNPPWDQLRPSRDDYFSRYDERFRSRMPSDKDAKEAELLEDESIAEDWEQYQQGIEIQMHYFTDGSSYDLQTPTVAGRKDPNENNLAALFLERVFDLSREDAHMAQVLPGVIFNGSFSKDLRLKMLDEASIESLVLFENKGIFDAIDNRYNFGIVTLDKAQPTDTLSGIFHQHSVEVLRELEKHAVEIPRRVLEEYSPEARIFPFVTTQEEVDVLNKILSHPPLGQEIEDAWMALPHRELDRSRDSDRFVESKLKVTIRSMVVGIFSNFCTTIPC
ncbi:Eco57I restriction-modification methylase domain-containing protein [Halomicroarcula sp. GCM10025710]